jgi:hypothetical protein
MCRRSAHNVWIVWRLTILFLGDLRAPMPLTTCQRQHALGVLIYRKPFRQLFSAVGYGTIGSQERAECAFRDLDGRAGRIGVDLA